MGKTIKVDDSLLTESQLSSALSLSVQDADVRHFHCGFCTAYLSDLAKRFQSIASSDVRADPKAPQLIVIGHGKPEGIKRYREIIPDGFPFDIYTDPKRKFYQALGVRNENLDMGKSKDLPQHVQRLPALRIVLSSTLESLTSGALMWKGGPISVLGADFVFDAQGKNTFAHRMVNTRDHTDVDILASKMGIETEGTVEKVAEETAAPTQEPVQEMETSEAVQQHADALASAQKEVTPASAVEAAA